ncbi:MAG: thiamine pyrophosphate-dependent enzyme [Candidatus Aenigmatarchaeota archaeon]
MKIEDLDTKEEKTWCIGCTNNGILLAVKQAIVDLVNSNKIKLNNLVIATGIGCHAKIYGRVIPTLLGIKLANPQLTLIGFGGDGDTYAEGMSHFVHACRYNVDMTMIVHNNQTFALTTGQATPTSEIGFKGKSTPFGTTERPINPIALALASGATFIARGYALDVEHLKNIIKAGIEHKGFSFIDILQPCLTYHNTISYFKDRFYKIENHDNYENALKEALKWDYSLDENAKIPIGIFYKVNKRIYMESSQKTPLYKIKREMNLNVLEEFR